MTRRRKNVEWMYSRRMIPQPAVLLLRRLFLISLIIIIHICIRHHHHQQQSSFTTPPVVIVLSFLLVIPPPSPLSLRIKPSRSSHHHHHHRFVRLVVNRSSPPQSSLSSSTTTNEPLDDDNEKNSTNMVQQRHHPPRTFLSRPLMKDHSQRRQFIQQSIITTTTSMIITTTPSLAAATTATATTTTSSHPYVRGAAELDLEYYIRDLFGTQNERMGNMAPSLPPPMKPPRTMTNPVLNLLLVPFSPNDTTTTTTTNTVCGDCTIRALIDTILQQQPQQPSKNEIPLTSTKIQSLRHDITQSMQQYQTKVSNSFYQRAAWRNSHISDQYYFDMISYTIWKTAAVYLPTSNQRSQFVATLGQYIYQCSVPSQQLISISTNTDTNRQQHPLTGTNQNVQQVLDLFTQCGLIQSYRIGTGTTSTSSSHHNNDQNRTPLATTTTTTTPEPFVLFDTYDDEAFLNHDSVDVVLSIYESATLGASLQLTGEQSRFIPDYIAPTLMALWYNTIPGPRGSWSLTYETYFLDSTYRPNPKGTFLEWITLSISVFLRERASYLYV